MKKRPTNSVPAKFEFHVEEPLSPAPLEDTFELDFKEENGLCRYYRHHYDGEECPHNPSWVSVRGIDLELDEAFFNVGDTRRLSQHVLEIEAWDPSLFYGDIETPAETPEEPNPKEQPETGENTKKPQGACSPNEKMQELKARLASEKKVSLRSLVSRKYFRSDLNPEHPFHANDDDLADLIHAAPEALLRSYQAQDACSRWTYAASVCSDADTREKAKKLLETCFPPNRGRPKKTHPNLPQLLVAYEDLLTYCRCVYRAAQEKTARTPEEIRGLFPEVEQLEPFGLTLDDVCNARYTNPAASDVACKYIANFCGLSVSRVTDLISKARNIQA